MTGMAKASLEDDRKKLVKSVKRFETAVSKLKNTNSKYYQEHLILIDVYKKKINCIDLALEDLRLADGL